MLDSQTIRVGTMRQDRLEANEGAISILRHVLTGAPEAAAEVRAWATAVQNHRHGGHPLTVLEHAVMAYILRSGFVYRMSDRRCHRDIEAILGASWMSLTGKPAGPEMLTGRLPRSVLRSAGREARLFHLAAFQPPGPTAAGSAGSTACDYVPEWRDLIAVVGLVALVFVDIAGSVLCSVAAGYAIASIVEYGMHRWAGHEAGGPMKPFLDKSGWIGATISDYLAAIYIGHFVIHHVKTSNRNYTTQFSAHPPGDRSTIDAELEAMGEVGMDIKKSDYGMTLTHAGVTAGLLVTLPICVILIWILGLEFLSAVALMTPSLLYVAASKILHPCLHMSREEAMAKSGPFMRLLLRTRYAEWISRSHWIHHKGGGGNYNLVPGADILFADFRKPNLTMVLRMRADGILGARWGG